MCDGRLNQQQCRCGEEQKVFHHILPAFLKIGTPCQSFLP
jgi:hypothetical protein